MRDPANTFDVRADLEATRNAPALVYKLAALIRLRIIELTGEIHAPSVLELVTILEEELNLFQLITIVRSDAYAELGDVTQGDSLLGRLETWRLRITEGGHFEPPQ